MTEDSQDTAPPSPEETPSEPAADTPPPAPAPTPIPPPAADGDEPLYYWGTGRRKTSVARVRLKPGGSGQVFVNKRPLDEYFYRAQDRKNVTDPLKLTKALDRLDVHVNVNGGGMSGQSGASRMGIARALMKLNSEYVDMLRESGYLTRDARSKERKKYGKAGARASFQFSKR